MTSNHDWSEESIVRMLDLLDSGMSSAKVAVTLSKEFRTSLTRSSILGKLHRLRKWSNENDLGKSCLQ